MFEDISKELQQARLKNNMSVEQLSTKTRIDIKFIEAIERGDFAFLPDLYVKAFIKQYAKAVDLDEDIIIKKYEAAKSGGIYQQQDEKEPVEAKSEKHEKKIIEEPSASVYTFDAVSHPKQNIKDSFFEKNRFILGGIIVAVVFIFAFVYFFFLNKSEEIIVPEKPIEEVIKENKERFNAEKEKDSMKAANLAAVSDSLLLTIRASDTSWVKIILDGKKEDEFILFPKSQKVVAAENDYQITLGNSGGINLLLNNKPLNFTGKKGAIKYIEINNEGLKYLKKPPSL